MSNGNMFLNREEKDVLKLDEKKVRVKVYNTNKYNGIANFLTSTNGKTMIIKKIIMYARIR